MSQFDIKQVANAAIDQIENVLSHWVPDGSYEGKEYVALNPTRGDGSKGSFSVNRNTGAWGDFATNDKGGDLVALVAYIERCNQGEACQRLAIFLGLTPNSELHTKTPKPKANKTTWQPIMPVPSKALSTCPQKHYTNGAPSFTWTYHNKSGQLLMKVLRFDVDTKGKRTKDYRPLTYCQSNHGKKEWRWQQPVKNRPLYGLDRLEQNQQQVVLLTEGEKAADAAIGLMPNHVAMTWAGGSNALLKTDFAPLSGRNVILWPDNDAAGIDCMDKLKLILEALNCTVSIIDLSAFKNWPDKADAADSIAHGLSAEILEQHNKANRLLLSEAKAETPGDSNPQNISHTRFVCNDKGVYFKNDNDDEGGLIRLCNRLDIVAFTRDKLGRNWGLLVRFTDPDGIAKEWNIPTEYLATEGGAEVLRQLFNLGLRAESGQQPRRRLIQYLQTTETLNRYTLVNRLGWHGKAFLLPNCTMGKPKEPLYFYSDSPDLNKLSSKGKLSEWQKSIAHYCQENPLLLFAVSAAFAAPLLHLIGMETTGFHFYGDSSQGKTTLLKVAASVYGSPDYVRTWRSTDNALEGIAAAHSDGLLILDEISQCDPRLVGDIAYLLGNGKGKSRANDRGGVKSNNLEWRLVFLSTGEKTLDQHMAEAGKKPKAGQEARLLAIPANAGDNKGIFNDLHNFAGGAALSSHLVKHCAQQHGTPFYDFIENLCNSDLKKLTGHIRRDLVNALADLPSDASGQVTRAAEKFALVGFAGELATHAGVTGWKKGQAKQAAKTVFNHWLNARGSIGNLEDRQILSQIKHFFESHGEARFTRWDRDDSTVDEHGIRTINRCGYRKTLDDANVLGDTSCEASDGNKCSETIYYVYQEAFKTEICNGLNIARAKELMAECGSLERDSSGKFSKPIRLPSAGRKLQRVHIIKPHLIPNYEAEAITEKAA